MGSELTRRARELDDSLESDTCEHTEPNPYLCGDCRLAVIEKALAGHGADVRRRTIDIEFEVSSGGSDPTVLRKELGHLCGEDGD